MQRHIIAILLQNETGALARVAGLIAGRGYNIESLSVAATHDPELSRLTLTTRGEAAIVEQIVKQLRKLIDVLEVANLSHHAPLERELLLVKIRTRAGSSTALEACLKRHQATALSDVDGIRSLQYIGVGDSAAVFLKELEPHAELLELARSGSAALVPGAHILGEPAGHHADAQSSPLA